MTSNVKSSRAIQKAVVWVLAAAILLTLLPSFSAFAEEPEEYDVVFLSDLHNGVGGYPGLIQMMDELRSEGQSPRVLSHGGDYVEDGMGGQVDWQTRVYDVISGAERAVFPDAAQVYTLGNHDFEAGTFGGRSDKEAAFGELFGFPRCGLVYSDDELEIYTIGAQCTTDAGGGREAFEEEDIEAFNRYLASRAGTDKVIFLQTHWPAHSSYNFKQRVVDNADLLIDTVNQYGTDMDIVWIWGHNHYEDTMRYEILTPGSELMYSADTVGSFWGSPRNPKYKTISFTYANCGCMNDMWYLQDGRNDTSAANNYRGPSACLSAAVDAETITLTYNRIKQENGEWVFSHDADVQIHNTTMAHPATVVVERGHGGELLPPDCTELEAAIAAAEALDLSPYTDASAAAVTAALEAAREARSETRQSAVNAAAAALNGAIQALELRPVPLDAEFVLADRIEAGKTYVIVADGQYAMTNESVPGKETYSGMTTTRGAVPVEIAGGVITSDVYSSMLWTAGAAGTAYDGMRQYYLTDCEGNYLRRGSMSLMNSGLTLDARRVQFNRYYTWSFKAYEGEDAAFAMYVNSERAYGSDFPGRVRGDANGFDIPGTLTHRSEDDPFAFLYDGVCSRITLYVDSSDAPVPLDKTALEAAIEAAGAVDTSLYTPASLAAMNTALASAKAARQAETQAEIDAAAAALEAALDALELKPILDFTTLEAAIEAASAVDTSLYTPASLAAMNTALSSARAARQAETQAEIDAAAAALETALAALELKPILDFTVLEAAIEAAGAVDASLYTDASVAAMETALSGAIAARTAADQAAIDSAAAALERAVNALKRKPAPLDSVFVRADRIEAGKAYVIVADGQYAMTNRQEGPALRTYAGSAATTLASAPVTVADGKITSEVTDDMLWTVEVCTAPAAYDGLAQYLLKDTYGNYLRRGSGSSGQGAQLLSEALCSTIRYNAWSFYPYEGEDAYALYANSERAYGTDYPFYVYGNETSFDSPGRAQRTADDPFAFTRNDDCSHITLYEQCCTDGHEFGAWTIVTAASCTQDGEEQRVCVNCGETERRTAPMLGHDYGSAVTAPTCTQGGNTTFTCARCGDSYTADETAALGHALIDHAARAATCTEKGWKAYRTCARCDYTTYQEIKALNHAWDGGTVTQQPTETEPGIKSYTCTRCGQIRTEEIPATSPDYIVVFDANRGSGTMADQVILRDTYAYLTKNAFTRTGYSFSGWNTAPDGSGTACTDGKKVKNLTAGTAITLYAQWKARTYTVKYSANGGTGAMDSIGATYDVPFALSANTFTRTGYTFNGWNTSYRGTGTAYSDGETVQNLATSGTKLLYAQWAPNSYEIAFDANGGVGEMENQSMRYGVSAALKKNAFTRTGYTFVSWNTEPDGSGTAYASGKSVSSLATEGTVTLYAQWKANTYTIKYAANSGSGSMAAQTLTYDLSGVLSANAYTRTGYSFTGWNTAANGSGVPFFDTQTVVNLAVSGTVTMYAQWSPNAYEIVFDANGGVGEMENQSMTYGIYATIPKSAFTRKGYSCASWNTEPDGSGTTCIAGRSARNLAPSGTVTLYAQWKANTYTIKYVSNGGSGSMAAQKATYDLPIVLSTHIYTRTGYTFTGWNTAADGSGLPFFDDQTVLNLAASGTVSLYAQWSPNPYEIAFDANGGTGEMENQPMTYGVYAVISKSAFTREGYTCASWNTAPDGSGTTYIAGRSAKNLAPGGTATLYAKWKPNTITVVFYANKGTGTMSSQKLTYDVPANLNENQFTREGYTFTGWNTKADGTGTAYTDAQAVENIALSGTVKLYAQWKQS